MANFFTLIVKQHHLCFCVELIGGVTHDVYMYICIQRARSTWSTCCNAWRRRKSLANIIEVREKPIFLSNFVLLVYLASTAAALFVGFCIYPLPPPPPLAPLCQTIWWRLSGNLPINFALRRPLFTNLRSCWCAAHCYC